MLKSKMLLPMLLTLFDDGGQGGNGGQGDSGNNPNNNDNARFTYEQLDEIATSRSERAARSAVADYLRKQGLNETEITAAIADYKEKKKSSQPDVSAVEKERDDARAELQKLKNEKILAKKGVKEEDLDYVMFKVEKLVDDKTDFEKAAAKFLKDNPRFTSSAAGSYRIVSSSTGSDTQNSRGKNGSINDAIRNAIRR